MQRYFNPFLVTLVAAQCLPYGKQRLCAKQPTLILLNHDRSLEGKPIMSIKATFFLVSGEAIMLKCKQLAALIQLHAL